MDISISEEWKKARNGFGTVSFVSLSQASTSERVPYLIHQGKDPLVERREAERKSGKKQNFQL